MKEVLLFHRERTLLGAKKIDRLSVVPNQQPGFLCEKPDRIAYVVILEVQGVELWVVSKADLSRHQGASDHLEYPSHLFTEGGFHLFTFSKDIRTLFVQLYRSISELSMKGVSSYEVSSRNKARIERTIFSPRSHRGLKGKGWIAGS